MESGRADKGAAYLPGAGTPADPGRRNPSALRPLASDADPDLAGLTVLLVGQSAREMRQLSIWVDAFGGIGLTTGQGKTALSWLARPGRGAAVAVVDGDDLGDADDIADFGFELRRTAPDVPIILLSSSVRRNDFGTERMMICDVTLVSPVSMSAFKLALAAASDNHRHYLQAVHPTPDA